MLKHLWTRLLVCVILSFSMLLVTGCNGCRDDKQKTAEQEKKEEEEKKEREKPIFETKPVVIYPGQFSKSIRANRAKRGHWVSADFRIQANKFDTQGDLSATSYGTTSPAAVEGTDYFAVSTRPFSIPKGELRNLETNFYIPRRNKGSSANVNFTMKQSAGGLAQFSEIHGVPLMTPCQYHMVVLTNRPDAYSYLQIIDSVALPMFDETGTRLPPFYTVVRTRPAAEPIALPRQSLYWTTISYLIWDDLTVDQLDADQRQALIDWLHFGGQLILSGPDCLDKLGSSFLSDYLPARFSGSRNFTAGDFEEINQHWAIKMKNQDRRRVIAVSENSPILGIDFDVHPQATFVTNTGKIAVERKIGRGRIVATAFSLRDKPIIRWRSYNSFFNGALLRRPGRRFGTVSNDGCLSFVWNSDSTSIFDPLLGSTLRYLSRDLVDSQSTNAKEGTPKDPDISVEQITGISFSNQYPLNPEFGQMGEGRFRTTDGEAHEYRNLADHWHYGGYQHDTQSGTAGWNDNSGISRAARDTLKRAAGISPPSSGFVFRMLAIYLFVLVPVNWLLFRLIGRVEWAWIAAPFIAIGGAIVVAKMASLDIGFVRSNSQVACLEVFADYNRGHLSQYSALYTSLSTGYDLELDNPSAQSLPLGKATKRWREKTLLPVTIRKTINSRLEGFQVQSNTTGMLHTEMMLDMSGAISLVPSDQGLRLDNSTLIEMLECAVVRRTKTGELQSAWVGELSAGGSTVLDFRSIDDIMKPWEHSETLTTQDTAEKYLKKLWTNLGWVPSFDDHKNKPLIPVAAIKQHLPEIEKKWEKFLRLLSQRVSVSTRDEMIAMSIEFDTFRQIVEQLENVGSVNVSGIFREVAGTLILAPGETRMLAITNQTLGNNTFSPASTQTQQQTLVVVHLKRPDLPPATVDANALEDFSGRSNLDWLDEEKKLNELSETLDDEQE